MFCVCIAFAGWFETLVFRWKLAPSYLLGAESFV